MKKTENEPNYAAKQQYNKETENVVKLLVDQEVATIRSTLGRRRSTRKVLVPELLEPPYQPFAGSGKIKRTSDSDALVSSFSCASSLSHLCACIARCLDQVKFASSDHLAYTHGIFELPFP